MPDRSLNCIDRSSVLAALAIIVFAADLEGCVNASAPSGGPTGSPAPSSTPANGISAPSAGIDGAAAEAAPREGATISYASEHSAAGGGGGGAMGVTASSLALVSAGVRTCEGTVRVVIHRGSYGGPVAVSVRGLPPDAVAHAASIPPGGSMVGVLVTATASCNFLSTTAKVRVATAHGEVAEASFLLTAGDLGRWFGNLDETYGPQGYRATSQPGTGTGIAAVAGGRVVLLSSSCVLGRYGRDAVLDSTFGAGGMVALVSPPPLPGRASCDGSLTVLPDGRLLVSPASRSTVGVNAAARFYRLSSEGQPDSTFGNAGSLSLDAGEAWTRDRQGGLLVVAADPAAVGPLAVRRYDGDGQLDPSFASFTIPNGKVEVVAADDAGLFAGWSRPVPGQDPTTEVVIRRTLWGGTPDPAFGPDGEMTLPTAGGHYFNDTPGPAWMLATGAVVIATSTYDSDGWSTQGALFRMEPPLALGASWTTTKLITTLGIAHVTEEPGGTLLIGSSTARHNGPGYSDLARIGATGVVLTDGPYDPGPMVLLGDGTALAAGTVGDSPVFTTTLSRFLIP